MTLLPWEYLFQPFSRNGFPDLYNATWATGLALVVASIILYNWRTRVLHRHAPYLDLWEWLLWASVISGFMLVVASIFSFDFFIVLATVAFGVGTMLYARFWRFPPLFAIYEQKLARQRYFTKTKFSRPEATIRAKPSRRRRRH